MEHALRNGGTENEMVSVGLVSPEGRKTLEME